MVLWPAYMTIAGVLGLAGLAKVRAPASTMKTLASAGLPDSRGAVRALGVLELAVAAACVAAPGRLAALALAAVYLVFAGTVIRLRLARAGGSCGCFGETSASAGIWHVGLNFAAAAVTLAAVASPPPGWGTVAEHPAELGAALAGVAACIGLARLAFTTFPEAWNAYGAPRGTEAAR